MRPFVVNHGFWSNLLLFLLFVPTIFLGVDFTDSGYHFFNQNQFSIGSTIIQSNGYYWLSDLIGGLSQRALPIQNLFLFRLLGLITWLIVALFSFRYFTYFLKKFTNDETDPFALKLSLAIGLCFSIKNITSPLVLADYFTIPIVAICWILILFDQCLRKTCTGSMRIAFFAIIFLLPLLRWPLITTSLFLLVFYIFIFYSSSDRNKQRWPHEFLIALIASIGFAFTYKKFFLESFLGQNKIADSHYTKIISLYLRDLLTLAPWLSAWLVFLILNYFLYKKFKNAKFVFTKNISIYFSILGIIVFLLGYLVTYEWNVYLPTFTLQKYLSTLIWICGGLALLFIGLLTPHSSTERYILFLLFALPSLYFLGSDSGIGKSAYLGFLCSTPFFYLVSTRYFAGTLGKSFLLTFLALGLCHLYQSVYRDDLGQIIQNTEIISNPTIGIALSQPQTKKLLTDFQELQSSVLNSENSKIIIPNAPLLASHLSHTTRSSLAHTRLVWPDILQESERIHFVNELCSQNHPFELILVKKNLIFPSRDGDLNQEKIEFFKAVQLSCKSVDLKFENASFKVYLGQ